MSNSSLPSPSPCGSWPWVIVHTFPHSLSPCLSLSLSLFPSTWRGFFLPSFSSDCPTGKLNRIASLRWLIHQHRELHSTPPALQPRQPTTPHPGLDPSPPWPACFDVSPCIYLFACITACLPGCHFPFLSVRLLFSQDISLCICFNTCVLYSYCLSVFIPACTVYLHAHTGMKWYWISFALALLFVSLPAYLPFWLCLSVCPPALNCKVKIAKDTEHRLPCLHFKPRRLRQKNNDSGK